MPDRPLAYFITYTTYGTWLHGEAPGSVDREHNQVGTPWLEPDSQRLLPTAFGLHPPSSVGGLSCFRGWPLHAVHVRSNHVQNTNWQYNLPPLTKKLSYKSNRDGVAERFGDRSVRKMVGLDLSLIGQLDAHLNDVELYLERTAKIDDPQNFHLLRTIPGVGKILALVLLYEIYDIRRFESVGRFISYCRLVKCAHESAGKKSGSGGSKIGNAHLKWALCLGRPCRSKK